MNERWPPRLALMVAHCAGMVDLVALPVWVGTLIAWYRLDPQQAGGLATLFLAGAVVSSLFFAPRLHRMPGRTAASGGFAVAGLAFALVNFSGNYVAMAALHALAGLATGCALSFTHGTIGRSAQAHRLFAQAGMALGVFAILFMGVVPQLVHVVGGPVLFWVFAAVMLAAAVICAVAFPGDTVGFQHTAAPAVTLPATVWFAVFGVASMALVQAMIFSFLERIGADHGFSTEAVTGVLVGLGIVNLFPAALAALLERRWPARRVMLVGPVVQAPLALGITQAASFVTFAAPAVFFVAVMIFTHTFAFGLIARLDPSGRALAATPAMLMTGAAIGPILGGTLVKLGGYASLGVAAGLIAAAAMYFFSRSSSAGPESKNGGVAEIQ